MFRIAIQAHNNLTVVSCLFAFFFVSVLQLIRSAFWDVNFQEVLETIQIQGILSTSDSNRVTFISKKALATRKPLQITNDGRVPENLRLAFLGDSVLRYQYLDFVYYLLTNHWVQNDEYPNLVIERNFSGWSDFYNKTNLMMQGTEQCDCFRPKSKSIRPKRCFENRYFADPTKGNYVSYIQKFGYYLAQGHWNSNDVWDTKHTVILGTPLFTHPVWRYNWVDVIKYHIQHLQPRPDYLVFNAGLWEHDLNNETLFKEIQSTLQDANITGIYKTTSARRSEPFSYLKSHHSHDFIACKFFLCLNYSWTAELDDREYWDPVHMKASVNQRFNEQLLQLIQEHANSMR